ncbi:response regulator transcription factor [Chryseobacterium sp. PBS4-4]|uniref:Response regulator transcription factor n=1 Tax=Chryseobacterium edaphi TaxID=2976532 RepID=A0ABT2W9R6_9FLAO|nr:response regulator transcription factor [Chryseobacterium edaphi]MCU7618963.1 response regulator transcription factor [Chryseobacterium edaphi]
MNHPDNTSLNFLLADDHSLIRQGIAFLLEDLSLEHVVFHASNLQQTLEVIKINPIHIAIIDAHFPDGNSLTVLPEIKKIRSETKILIFTGIDESTHSLKFINAGANGFLSKLSEEEEIKRAILKMKNDGEYLSSATQALLMNSFRDRKLINPLYGLTERELQIAELYTKGNGNLEIANLLDLKQNTVSTIKKRIFEKLKVENIVELIELVKNHQ